MHTSRGSNFEKIEACCPEVSGNSVYVKKIRGLFDGPHQVLWRMGVNGYGGAVQGLSYNKCGEAGDNVSQEQPADFDNPWKEMLGSYFREFMAFFFADVHAEIDWARDPVFLDKELQQVAREAELGRRTVDKLVQIWKHDGESSWVLIHVEVLSQYDPDFAKRMIVYYYRLFDLYDRPVASFAVGDERRSWRPQQFQAGLWGTSQVFTFTVAKLLDYEPSQLESDPNLFATVVLAHLKTQETDDNPTERQRWKLLLTRRLYEQGYDRDGILAVFGFIDWLLAKPAVGICACRLS
jgi:hypothetical protein